MAEALINFLIQQLGSLAYEHTKQAVTLVLNAKKDVKKFSHSLKAIQAVLEDAEKQQVKEASVRDWLDQLKDVSYEMDEVLDEWNTEILIQEVEAKQEEEGENALVNKKKVCFCISSNLFCFGQVNKAIHHHSIASKIKELNEKLTLIAAERDQYNFHQSSVGGIDEQLNQGRKTSSIVDMSMIFGREEEKANLLSKLLRESSEEGKRLLVIPIVGMGGMGKTTLAQLAYNNENVKTYFEKRIWVCVSDPFDEVKIAKAIISGTGNDTPNSSELEDVLQCMSKSIEGKKTLIVLDDVWTEEEKQWENLKLPIIMQNCANGSRILVTTRKEGVAQMMRATTHMIHLEKLSDQNCLALFNSIAFLDREEDRTNGFGAIGEEIVKKCKGLPLVAKSLGSLMYYKKTRREWQDVLDSKIWDLEELEQQVFQPLLLSYYDLAPAVKRCLLYCATFPKDYQFDKHNLIELWMSQDYLNMKEHNEKETIGEKVFDNLVMRSFFQDVVEDASYKKNTISCKMHDIVHDFVQFLDKNECSVMEANVRTEIGSEKVRHLTLMFTPDGTLSRLISFVNCKKLRTLRAFDSRITTLDSKAISQLKCLRTLNLSSNDVKELPEEIDELLHLRYFDLSDCRFLEKLPNSLCNLYNLQTLRLGYCSNLQNLPEDMGNLINLRHLHIESCHGLKYLPKGIRRLTSLRTLDECPVYGSDLDVAFKLGDLGSLDQLQGSFTIKILGNGKDTIDAETACLWNKKNLLHLTIHLQQFIGSGAEILNGLRPHQDLEYLHILWYYGTTFPDWMIFLHNLRVLNLEYCDVCELLPPLGKLPFLEQLSLFRMIKVKTVGDEFLGMESQTSVSSSSSSSILFPKLKNISFQTMLEWEEWEGVGGWTESGNDIRIMPSLSSFKISYCPKLMNLPVFLPKTPVKNISISSCHRDIIIPVWPDNCDVNFDVRDPWGEEEEEEEEEEE